MSCFPLRCCRMTTRRSPPARVVPRRATPFRSSPRSSARFGWHRPGSHQGRTRELHRDGIESREQFRSSRTAVCAAGPGRGRTPIAPLCAVLTETGLALRWREKAASNKEGSDVNAMTSPRIRRDRRLCTLKKKAVYLQTEMHPVDVLGASSPVEWVPGAQNCSDEHDCQLKRVDCLWAVGSSVSAIDRMAPVPKA